MKRVLAFLLDIASNRPWRARAAFHDDTLRANQGNPAYNFSYWRSLVG
jgi:hypothetical protein